MNEIPIQAILVPVIGLAVVIYMYVYRRKKVASVDQQYSQYRAGELAQRLGLTLVEGDPNFNLFVKQADKSVSSGPTDKKAVDIDIRMTGERDGVPLELYYLFRVEQKTGFTEVTRTTWFDCRMVAKAKTQFPPFEVISRKAPMGPIATTQALPAAATGDAGIDGVYAVSTNEPRMAAELAKVLPGFATFNNSGIHLVGDGESVAFVMNESKAPLLANALYFAEAMADQLVATARAVGG
jgi:hypothetical protein